MRYGRRLSRPDALPDVHALRGRYLRPRAAADVLTVQNGQVSFSNQTANFVLAGPTSGSAAAQPASMGSITAATVPPILVLATSES